MKILDSFLLDVSGAKKGSCKIFLFLVHSTETSELQTGVKCGWAMILWDSGRLWKFIWQPDQDGEIGFQILLNFLHPRKMGPES